MSEQLSRILNDALRLPPVERAAVVEGLLSSLDRPIPRSMLNGRRRQRNELQHMMPVASLPMMLKTYLPNWIASEGAIPRASPR